MAAERPFVDFYRKHGISPVAQDISDLDRHYERRDSLYRLLGIPPRFVAERDVIEFGPGSGYNAIATASYGPRRYVFVDANPTGIGRLRELFVEHAPDLRIEIVDSLIERYESEERFDLVICEGVIPFQHEPKAFARHVARSAKPGGVISLTTIDAASFMGDLGRRLLADKLVSPALAAPQRVELLAPIFRAQLAGLAGMSRPVEDYLYDNIVQPLHGHMFSIADAIAALEGTGDFYGSSPQFVTELRWFKTLYAEARDFNARAIDAYRRNVANLLDSRVTLAPHEPEVGDALLALADEIYRLMQAFEASGAATMDQIASRVAALADTVAPLSAPTRAALAELAEALASPRLEALPNGSFASYFGRGMQYVSFIAR
jgi:SAM-dependent methyltransferase